MQPDCIHDRDKGGNSVAHYAANKGKVAALEWIYEHDRECVATRNLKVRTFHNTMLLNGHC